MTSMLHVAALTTLGLVGYAVLLVLLLAGLARANRWSLSRAQAREAHDGPLRREAFARDAQVVQARLEQAGLVTPGRPLVTA